MLIDLRSKGVTGKVAEETLGKADITVNKNMVPFDTQSPMVTSGMRIGTAAITTRGFSEADCAQVVDWVDKALSGVTNESLLKETRRQVNEWMERFPLYETQGKAM